jgi:hypothetical protein
MNIIFSINGGIGKCVMATAVCKAIKKLYKKANLIVISGYPEVFINNPNVHRSYAFGTTSYFYEEYIKNEKVLVFANDPYLTTEHIKQEQHLIKTWCDMYGIEYSGEKPEIYLTAREQKFFAAQYITDKPILLIQPNGGSPTDMKYSWARDIPYDLMQDIVNEMCNDYHVVHVGREDQSKYQNTTPVNASFRQLCVLMSMSSKRLLIDSFGQHVAAAFNLPSTVCWIANKPEVFGYDIHDNIKANEFTVKPELRNSFLSEFNIQGDLLEFPYRSEAEIFDRDAILNSLKK